MAEYTRVELVDDLDGSEANETVDFALDNTEYKIDLSDKNAAGLRGALAEYVGAARRTGRSGPKFGSGEHGNKAKFYNDPELLRKMRVWGREQGWTVSDNGRVPNDVMAAYNKAH